MEEGKAIAVPAECSSLVEGSETPEIIKAPISLAPVAPETEQPIALPRKKMSIVFDPELGIEAGEEVTGTATEAGSEQEEADAEEALSVITDIKKTKLELEELQVQTIYSLVETVNIGRTTKKVLCLTNNQARKIDLSTLDKFFLSFDIPTSGVKKPKLVINLFESTQFVPFNSYSLTIDKDQPYSGELNVDVANETDEKIAIFLKKDLIPVALQTNAIVILHSSSCTFSRIMSELCTVLAASKQGQLPFYVFQFAATYQYWKSAETDGTLANKIMKQSTRWQAIQPALRKMWCPGGPRQTERTKAAIEIDDIALLNGVTHYVLIDCTILYFYFHTVFLYLVCYRLGFRYSPSDRLDPFI